MDFEIENGVLIKYHGPGGDVVIPDSVTSIGDEAFEWCESLTSITIPDSVTSIGKEAFRGCKSLTSITIPDSVTSIGDEAFESCGLTSITIPDKVSHIGYKVFAGTELSIIDTGVKLSEDCFGHEWNPCIINDPAMLPSKR